MRRMREEAEMSGTIPSEVEVAYKRLIECTETTEICAQIRRSHDTRYMIQVTTEELDEARTALGEAQDEFLQVCRDSNTDPRDVGIALNRRSPLIRRLPQPALGERDRAPRLTA